MQKFFLLLSCVCFFLIASCAHQGQYKVLRVIDGDTIVVDYHGEKEVVRLLNVDTPESVHPDPSRNTQRGKNAADYTRKRLEGKKVDLVFEDKKRGKYGRLLAYVFIDGKNFCVELVEKGWSEYYTKYGISKKFNSEFVSAENCKHKS